VETTKISERNIFKRENSKYELTFKVGLGASSSGKYVLDV